ncbi:MAG: VPS10 domain-containing protein [Chitinophagia bacterium]
MHTKHFHKKAYSLFMLAISLLCLVQAQVKPTAGSERLKSLEAKNRNIENSLMKDVSFRNIGPAIMSGRVDDIEVNPNDPTEFYVAYATGGLWHTTNNGQSFTPIFDKEHVIGIGDIAVDWKNKNIWVGTGEVNSSRSSYAGIGVYKSSNNGKSWEYLGLPESQHIGKILLHPGDPKTAWVAVLGHLYSPNKDRGVFKTTDGGKTWKHILMIDEYTGTVEMDINPSNPNELYAASWHRIRKGWDFTEGGKTSGIHKSSDGGETWQLMTTDGSGFPQGDGIGRIGVAVSAKDPAIVYAVVDNYNLKPDTAKADTGRIVVKDLRTMSNEAFGMYSDGAIERFIRANGLSAQFNNAKSMKDAINAGKISLVELYQYLFDEGAGPSANQIHGCEVYKSINGGKNWSKTHEKPIGIYNTFGYYFGKIFVSPVNPDKIVITGVNANLSIDGGKTFVSMDKGNTHADWHSVWINPKRDSHMITGNDGGCNITYDDGKNWFKANTPSVGQFYAINVDNEKPYNVYGGLQDNGSWYGPSTHKESNDWTDDGQYAYKRLNGGDGMQVQIDPRDHNIVYSGSQFGAYSRITKNNPSNRFLRPPSGSLQEPKNRFNWQTPILLSKHNPDILYMGANRLFRSMNKGDQFERISSDLTNGRKIGDVPYGTLTTISESPFKFGLLYAGSDDGVVSVSKDGGNSWNRLKLPQQLYVSRVLASRHVESRVYVTLNGYRNDHFEAYVYCSDDHGNTWKRLGTDLPQEPVNVIKEDPKQADLLYVGTDGGAYVSLDGGKFFQPFTNGLPKAIPVHDIAIQERENEIILGTHGRSLFIGKLDLVQKMATEKK